MMSRTHKVKSFESFGGDLRKHEPELVVVQADRRPPKGLLITPAFKSIGKLGLWQHGLHYEVHTRKKTRNYIESLFSTFQSEYGFGDAEERSDRVVSLILAGEVRVEMLEAFLPQTDVYLADINGQRMTEEISQKLHTEAEARGIVSPLPVHA